MPMSAMSDRTMVSVLGAAVFAFVAAAPFAARAQANCEPACAAGQTCVNGVCMIPAQPAAPAQPAYAAPPQQPAYAPPPQQPAYAPPAGYSAPPSYGYPPPPPAPPAARSGFQAVPFIGFHNYAGDGGEFTGPGLRIGTLLGGRLNENWSLNGELLFDFTNWNHAAYVNTSERWWDLAFSPLIHLPLGKLEVVVGPKLGFSRGSGKRYPDVQVGENDQTLSAIVFGLNAGLFVPVGGGAMIGGLLNVQSRAVTEYCARYQGIETCSQPDESLNVIALSVAALL